MHLRCLICKDLHLNMAKNHMTLILINKKVYINNRQTNYWTKKASKVYKVNFSGVKFNSERVLERNENCK